MLKGLFRNPPAGGLKKTACFNSLQLWQRKMNITEIQAKSILRKSKKIDSWFISRYGMNLYRGCSHNCAYCDGRAEKYQVEGEFGRDVAVKANAIGVLQHEMDPSRKRKPFKGGFLLVGGGVCDSYESVEAKYQLTQNALKLATQYDFPVHMLTKSILIERDLGILKTIDAKRRAIVSMSFSSVDDRVSAIFEPQVPRPSRRLKTLEKFKKEGIAVGMFLMPVIPFITDTPEKMEASVRAAKNAGVDFIIFAGMTLKEGRQQEHFFEVLKNHDPDLVLKYKNIYKGNQWGEATAEYSRAIHESFFEIARAYNMPVRIPPSLFVDILDESDRVVVILEHIDYLLKMRGEKSLYGYAAYSVSQINEPLSSLRENLQSLKGVGKTTEKLIWEILDTGTSKYYEWLLFGKPVVRKERK